ncbi:silencer-associated factor [Cryptosporidium ubiquitum]|uniref:CDP-diacylglycerol--glycerol-3-phosphate 3-phosphatidyltransferase n=1 Tax=Cryptosporidium ubiquitum TaxID=857276 RepID=A0A1J4ME37_9CRYT|nr:silencer-associated factor [Cryptosporidium ubiquitum]OII72496.1 silencer-associated factor [Cryptosporidium ubiquitum]
MAEEIVGKAFKVKDDQISVLDSPSSFKDSLNSILLNAKRRIYISSLYTDTENEITKTLCKVAENLEKNSNNDLKIKLILDYNRMTRECEKVKPYIKVFKKYPNSVVISLCKIPIINYSENLLGRTSWNIINILSKFRRTSFLKEVLGVYHIKIFLADDDIIITSANLNSEYLLNKQDRYIMIKGAKKICDYFEQSLDLISEYSHRVLPEGKILQPQKPQFNELKKDLMELSSGVDLHNQITSKIKMKLDDADISDECVLASYFQCRPIKIASEEQIITNISQLCDKKSTNVFLMAPYLNLPKYLISLLKNIEGSINIVSGVPITKSDKKNKIEKKTSLERIRTLILPKLYTYINYSLIKQLGTQEKGNISYHEYKKPNWSFHFKGIYFFRNSSKFDPSESGLQNQGSIIATAFGSSNYNYRSTNRDFECSFVLIPNQNKELQKSLKNELANIMNTTVKEYAPKITWRRLFIMKVIKIFQEYL